MNNSKFDKQAYEDMVNRVRELSEEPFNDENKPKNALWTNTKSIAIAAMVIALALVILIGAVILVPILLIGLLGYIVFLGVRISIK